jgi:hypothetical protein
MPLLLKDIQNGVIIPFSDSERSANLVVASFTTLSIGADLLAIYALLKQVYIPLDSRFILSMMLADLSFAIVIVVTFSINGKNTLFSFSQYLLILRYTPSLGFNNGWAIGHTGKTLRINGIDLK